MNFKVPTFITKCVYLLSALLVIGLQAKDTDQKPVNKMLEMYHLYYLPFSIDFKVGKTPNDILPYLIDENKSNPSLVKSAELKTLDDEWATMRQEIYDKSLLAKTEVPLNKSVRINNHLVSHHLPIRRSVFEHLPVDQRIQISKMLSERPPEVQAVFKQLTFLKSLMKDQDQDKYNFFIFSASWCESCRDYRSLIERYFRLFPEEKVVIHSVYFEDPDEKIFDQALLKELFCHPKKYSHESIPKFISLEFHGNVPVILEEGEAIKSIYERFLKPHRGYLDNKTSFMKKTRPLQRDTASSGM